MKFLVVDDSATMRRIVVNSLKRIGYESCVEAGDGQEGLDAFDDSIEFVITDWNMPNMGGLEFVQALRSGPGANVPIIMVTTRSVKEDIVLAAQAGVNNYVVKPFTPQVLKEKIDQVMGAISGAA